MRKSFVLFLILIECLFFVGCKGLLEKDMELEYKPLSNKEEYILTLTGNKIMMYEMKNIPKEAKYEMSLVYEFYENGEKIKEDNIISIIDDNTGDKNMYKTIGINFEDKKIRYISGIEKSYSSGSYTPEEDIRSYSKCFFTSRTELKMDAEVYIFYANDGSSIAANIPLGEQISEEDKEKMVNAHQSVALVKLVIKEI